VPANWANTITGRTFLGMFCMRQRNKTIRRNPRSLIKYFAYLEGKLILMDPFTIVTVITIILVARLGIRLLFGWINRNQKNGDE
jgi:hypothetical protein